MPYYGFDLYYLILVIPALLISIWAQFRVQSAFRKYSKLRNHRGLTGAEAAQRILRENGVYDVHVAQVAGNLTDHFDPKEQVIRLSEGVYSSTSIAAVGIAAHEAGHAVQHHQQYMPIRLRNAVFPVARIGSMAAFPIVFLGLVFSFGVLITIGIVLFIGVFVFQLVTLPVEFNASGRALRIIDEQGLLSPEERKGAQKVLSAAALTYVAAVITTLANLLRLLLLSRNRSR